MWLNVLITFSSMVPLLINLVLFLISDRNKILVLKYNFFKCFMFDYFEDFIWMRVAKGKGIYCNQSSSFETEHYGGEGLILTIDEGYEAGGPFLLKDDPVTRMKSSSALDRLDHVVLKIKYEIDLRELEGSDDNREEADFSVHDRYSDYKVELRKLSEFFEYNKGGIKELDSIIIDEQRGALIVRVDCDDYVYYQLPLYTNGEVVTFQFLYNTWEGKYYIECLGGEILWASVKGEDFIKRKVSEVKDLAEENTLHRDPIRMKIGIKGEKTFKIGNVLVKLNEGNVRLIYKNYIDVFEDHIFDINSLITLVHIFEFWEAHPEVGVMSKGSFKKIYKRKETAITHVMTIQEIVNMVKNNHSVYVHKIKLVQMKYYCEGEKKDATTLEDDNCNLSSAVLSKIVGGIIGKGNSESLFRIIKHYGIVDPEECMFLIKKLVTLCSSINIIKSVKSNFYIGKKMPNWAYKRMLVDVNYLFTDIGFGCVSYIDKSIPVSLYTKRMKNSFSEAPRQLGKPITNIKAADLINDDEFLSKKVKSNLLRIEEKRKENIIFLNETAIVSDFSFIEKIEQDLKRLSNYIKSRRFKSDRTDKSYKEIASYHEKRIKFEENLGDAIFDGLKSLNYKEALVRGDRPGLLGSVYCSLSLPNLSKLCSEKEKKMEEIDEKKKKGEYSGRWFKAKRGKERRDGGGNKNKNKYKGGPDGDSLVNLRGFKETTSMGLIKKTFFNQSFFKKFLRTATGESKPREEKNKENNTTNDKGKSKGKFLGNKKISAEKSLKNRAIKELGINPIHINNFYEPLSGLDLESWGSEDNPKPVELEETLKKVVDVLLNIKKSRVLYKEKIVVVKREDEEEKRLAEELKRKEEERARENEKNRIEKENKEKEEKLKVELATRVKKMKEWKEGMFEFLGEGKESDCVKDFFSRGNGEEEEAYKFWVKLNEAEGCSTQKENKSKGKGGKGKLNNFQRNMTINRMFKGDDTEKVTYRSIKKYLESL
jgi:hypothetical protein